MVPLELGIIRGPINCEQGKGHMIEIFLESGCVTVRCRYKEERFSEKGHHGEPEHLS